MSEFGGKSIVVTGGSLGMGLACARRFAAGGGRVMIVANDRASVDEAVEEIGSHAAGFVGDVRRGADMQAAMAEAAARHGGIDILACCAGIQRYGTVVDTPEEVWDDVLDINLKGIFLAAKYAIPEMRKRGGGAIVGVPPQPDGRRRRQCHDDADDRRRNHHPLSLFGTEGEPRCPLNGVPPRARRPSGAS